MREGLRELCLDALQERGRDLHDVILDVGKQLPMIVAEEIENGLGCAPRPGSCLDDPDFVAPLVLLVELVRALDVVCDGHPVVRLENFAGRQPGIGRILLCEFALIVVVADEGFEVEGRLELAHLKV